MKKNTKKILAGTIIFGLISPSFALTPDLMEESSNKENYVLEKNEKIAKLAKNFVEKINSIEKAEEILDNLVKIKFEKKLTKKELLLIKYLEGNLYRKISELRKQEKEKKLQAVQARIEAKKISKIDKQTGEKEILNLQNILKKEINNSIDNTGKSLEKYFYIQEKGNLELNLKFDSNNFKLNLNDYFSNTQLFDNQLKTNLELLFNGKNYENQDMSLNISTYLEFIQKNGEQYLLLKNLKSNGKNLTNDIKIPLETISKIFKENKFVKIPQDFQSRQFYQMLNNFKKENFKVSIAKNLEKPLFTPYKKVGNKYYLIPTQNACDLLLKGISSVNPYIFYGKISCTKEIYQEMLIDIEDNNVEIYLENKKLGIKFNDKTMEKVEGFIDFNDNQVNQINFEAIPDQKKYPQEKFLFNYKKFEELKIYLNADKKNVFLDTNIVLDRLNRVKEIKINGNSNNYINKLKYNFEYKNNKFNGSFENNYKSFYDEKYIEKTTGKISGTTNYKNEIKKLDLIIKNPNFNLDFNINNKKFNGKLNVKNNNENIFNLSSFGEYDKDYFKLNSKFEIEEFTNNKEKIYGNFNMEADLRNGKDNTNILLKLEKDKKEFFNFNLKNIGKIEYKKQEIKAPKDYIEMNPRNDIIKNEIEIEELDF